MAKVKKLTNGDDVFVGSAKGESVLGRGGDDDIRGGGGNDTLKGGAGNDTLRGGNGDDTLVGGIGDDTMLGGAGDDTIEATVGNDIIDGGTGDDIIKIGADLATSVITDAPGGGYTITTADGRVITVTNAEVFDFNGTTVTVADLPREGQNLNLTTETNTINILEPNTVDTVNGVVANANDTFSNGDFIDGNGLTILDLVVAGTGAADVATVRDIASINMLNAVTGNVVFEASAWSNIGAIAVDSGSAGGDIDVNNLEDGVDLINNVEGDLDVVFAGGLEVLLANTTGDNELSMIDTNIVADVVASGDAYIMVSDDTSGDVTVGTITATVGDSGSLSIDVTTTNGDATVGDVTVTIGDGDSASFYLELDTSGGDASVGDVDITGGVSASASVYVTNNDGGSVTIGDVSIVQDAGGTDSYAALYAWNYDASGDVTVGAATLTAGASGDVTYSVSNTGVGGSSLGDTTLGDIALTVGNDGSIDFEVQVTTTATTGLETLGNVVIGDVTMVAGADASVSISVDMTFDGTASADAMGDFSMGDQTITIGIGGTLTASYTIANYASGNIGTVAFGDMTLNFDDGATGSVEYDISATNGDIGTVTFGDLNANLGVSATVDTYSIDITGNNIGSVTVGDVNIVAGENADFDSYDLGVSATSDIGSVTVGDVISDLGVNASLSYSLSVTAGNDIDTVTVGAIASAVATSGYAYHYINVSAGNDIGTVTLGDITFEAEGTGASVYLTLDVTAGASAGDIVIGNIDLTAHTGSVVEVDIDSTGVIDADISIDGLALHGASITSGDWAFTIGTATFTGDVTIGSIVIDVTAVAAGSFDLTADVLADVSTTGTITLGTVDYAGLAYTSNTTTGAVIDVSTYAGDITIIGSGFDDTITDNTETNIITGGAGADEFNFVFMNANGVGLSATKADVITDFETGVDEIVLDNTANALNVTAYFEGSAASFAAFIALANTQMTSSPEDDLVAVQVGTDVWLAFDSNNGDTVDQVIKLEGTTLGEINFADFAFV